VAILLLTFAPLQLIACLFAVFARDGGSASALGMYAATWTAIGLLLLTGKAGATSPAQGVFLIAVSGALLVLAAVAVSEKPALAMVLLVACVRFCVGAAYELSGTTALERVSGWLGLALALAGTYLALALLLEDAKKETVIPLFRRGTARRSLEADLDEQTEDIEQEAGVRSQL
jgi:succinate-acetate transporter protein